MGWNHPELIWNYPIVLYPLYHSGSRRFGVVEPPWTHSKLPCRPASPFITVVRGGSIGPPRTTLLIGEIGLQGSFKWVWGGSTTPNLLEQLWCMGKQACMVVSSEFRVDWQHRTSLNNCDGGESKPTGNFCVSFWWFDCTQHPWTNRAVSRDQGGLTTVNLLEPLCWLGKQAYRAGLSEFEVVQQHRNSTNHCDSNHCDAGGSRPVGQVRVSSGWFDHTKSLRTTVM